MADVAGIAVKPQQRRVRLARHMPRVNPYSVLSGQVYIAVFQAHFRGRRVELPTWEVDHEPVEYGHLTKHDSNDCTDSDEHGDPEQRLPSHLCYSLAPQGCYCRGQERHGESCNYGQVEPQRRQVRAEQHDFLQGVDGVSKGDNDG